MNTSGVTAIPNSSPADLSTMSSTRLIQGLSAFAYIGVFVAVVIAGISLAVSTAAAILDPKRVLGLIRLMRLMGMPVAVLRRVIVREAAVPLLAVLLLSVGLGFFVAWLMITSFGGDRTIPWPAPDYYAALSLSLLFALTAVAATFGLIRANAAMANELQKSQLRGEAKEYDCDARFFADFRDGIGRQRQPLAGRALDWVIVSRHGD
ncbi:FtsX-like permease family protein [Arthrobacter sp. A5]|uniref:FtsX-like permease family protein n=1 Tax=Arthrobacter sp. A5 TaxID=576926 RepID=UPI003DAA098E